MNQEKYTERMRGFLQSAQMLALREGHQRFIPDHLLKVLLDDPEGLAANLISAAGGDSRAVHRAVEASLAKQPKVEGQGAGQIYMAPETARIFDQAEAIAEKAGDAFVTVERMLMALALAKGTDAAEALAKAGVKPQALEKAIADLRKGRTADSASAESSYDALKKYARDLTQAAREKAMSAYHMFEYGSACFQLAIVLAGAAALTAVVWLTFVSLGLGAVGIGFTVLGFVAPTLVHI